MQNRNANNKKYKYERAEQVEANQKMSNKYNSGETFTPKNTKQIGLFKSNNKINRHSSEQEFKITPKIITINNQEINTNQDRNAFIKATTSTQYSIADEQELTPQKQNKRIRKIHVQTANVVQEQKKQQRRNPPQIIEQQGKYHSFHPGLTYEERRNTNTIKDQRNGDEMKSSVTSNALAFLHKSKDLIMKRKEGREGFTINNFRRIKQLGEGKFGKVFLVKEVLSGFVLAMKIIDKKILTGNLVTQFIRELKIQAYLEHPNIIKLYGFFHDSKNFYALMEVGCEGQLYSIIESNKILTEETTSFIIKKLLEAVCYMHGLKILHRDIKPENIVLVHGNVKICDFGWAVQKKDELRSTLCGTPLYLSPEILNGNKYDEKVDLWAIGILACQLRMGCLPFQINDKEDLQRIVTDEIQFPNHIKNISKEFKYFIESILNKNPNDRMESKELLKLHFIRKYEEFETCEELCQGSKKDIR